MYSVGTSTYSVQGYACCSVTSQSKSLCRSRCTEYQIEMSKSSGSWHVLQGSMYRYRAVHGGMIHSIVCTNTAVSQLSTYSHVLRIPKRLQVCTTIYYVCPRYVLGMYSVHTSTYWYILGKTKKTNLQNIQIQTVDLMHSILCPIQLRYKRAFHGDIYG